MKLDFAKIFADYVAATQKKWAHDRSKSVGASEAFGCLRATWFKKRGSEFGFTPDEDAKESWGATRRGDLIENYHVVPAVSGHLPTGRLLYAGEDQETLFAGYNSATPDGIIAGLDRDALADYGIPDIKSDCIMLEIKSIDPRVNLRREKDIHRGQTQVQMGLVRETTDFRPHYAVILYIDASFFDDMDIFVVEFDPEVWSAGKLRAETVFTVSDPAEIMPEGKIGGDCEHCKFTSACALVTTGSIPKDRAKELEQETIAEFEPLMAEYQEAQDAAKAAEKRFEEAKAAIKAQLLVADSKRVKGKGWSVSWYSQNGRKTLDTEKLKEALGVETLDDYTSVGDPFDVVRVTISG